MNYISYNTIEVFKKNIFIIKNIRKIGIVELLYIYIYKVIIC